MAGCIAVFHAFLSDGTAIAPVATEDLKQRMQK
jgi:hypothetical protein